VKRYFILLCFLFLAFILHAQKAILSGTVRDSVTRSPISFASIAILDAPDHVIDGVVADSLGSFRFSNLKKGKYTITIRFIGYTSKYIVVDFDGRSQIDLSEILLSTIGNRLEVVSIIGQAVTQQHTSDRQRYQASQYKNAIGGTALDIVKNLPSAAIDANGSISMRGNAGVIVLVNGKPSFLDPVTILNQIAANDVTEIEYITSPSAQFDSDGKGGIINIKTKKATIGGFAWVFSKVDSLA